MGRKIIDQFTGLAANYSRQYLWQLRKKAQGKCIICGAPAGDANHCEIHRLKVYQRYLTQYKRKRPVRKLSAKMQNLLAKGLALPAPFARFAKAEAARHKLKSKAAPRARRKASV